MLEATFLQHLNSASDVFNIIIKNYEKTKSDVIINHPLNYTIFPSIIVLF